VLRYDIAEALDAQWVMRLGQEVPDETITTVLPLSVRCQPARPGHARVRVQVGEARVEHPMTQVARAAVEARRDRLQTYDAYAFWWVIDDTGRRLDRGMEGPQQARFPSELQLARQALGELLPVLPEQPVGIGARWSVLRETAVNGLVSTRRVFYTLEAVDGRRLELAFEVEADFDEQPVMTAGLREGERLTLLEGRSQAEGSLSLRLDTMATRLDVTTREDRRLGHEQGGQPQTFDTVSLGRVRVQPAEAAAEPPDDD
jgi:hypothetical protein